MTRSPDQQLDDILRTFAQQVQEDYPALKNRFLVFDSTRQRMFGSFDMSAFDPAAAQVLKNEIGIAMDDALAFKGSFACDLSYMLGTQEIAAGKFISFGHGNELPQGVDLSGNPQILGFIHRVLYHELGHHMAAGMSDDKEHRHFAETAADIYSLIRLHKTFGRTTCLEQADLQCRSRINLMLQDEYRHHFTLPAIKSFVAVMDQIDFDALTLEAASELSRRFAFRHYMPDNALKELSEKFNDFRIQHKTISLQQAGDNLAEKALSDNDPLFVDTAHMIARKVGAAPDLLAALQLHALTLEKDGILSAIPKKQKPRTPATRFEK